jgi:hypothetical protein
LEEGKKQIKRGIRYFRTTGRKQHDFPRKHLKNISFISQHPDIPFDLVTTQNDLLESNTSGGNWRTFRLQQKIYNIALSEAWFVSMATKSTTVAETEKPRIC